MLSKIRTLSFWGTQPKAPHYLHMSALVRDICNLSHSADAIDFIEKKFKEAKDDVLYDATSKKYYLNRGCYSTCSWDSFFKDLNGLAVNLEGERNLTLLGVAVFMNALKLIKWLVEHQGADVNYGRTFSPLMIAASEGNIELMTYLLSKGADVNKQSKGINALYQAVRHGQVDAVDFLIKHNALLLKNSHELTPIELGERMIEIINKNKTLNQNEYMDLIEYDVMGNEVELPSLENMKKIMEMLKNSYEDQPSIILKK